MEIYIGEPFTFTVPDGHQHVLDPNADPLNLAPVLRIMRQVIREASALRDGRLQLSFADGSHIVVPFGKRYEAWHITGPDFTLISLPGGGLG